MAVDHGTISDFRQIMTRLDGVEDAVKNGNRNDKAPEKIPLIDPTANVKDLVDLRDAHQSEMREANNRRIDEIASLRATYDDKLAELRAVAAAESKRAESGRLDALLAANTQNVALALEKQGAQATGQDRRIAALEQNQWNTGGASSARETQRTEGRQSSQWMTTLMITSVLSFLGVLVAVAILLLKAK